MLTYVLTVVLWSATGTVIASVLACLPGLHVYNVIGLIIIGLPVLGVQANALPGEVTVPFTAGMIVGYSMLNTIPSILLAAPDESALFTVLPGQKYLMEGRGLEGILITAAGGLIGLTVLALVMALSGPTILPVVRLVLQPHMHWILWCVICFMLMSEWPKGGTMGQAGLIRLLQGWRSVSMGLLTFLLSGLLGFLLLYKSPLTVAASFQNLLPAFIGLFALPVLLVNLVARVEIPAQIRNCDINLDMRSALHGGLAGVLGGAFAAFFPGVTGGIGGFISGHAVSVRDDRTFLVSQGASKLVYYVGAFLLFFVPGAGLTRGGAAMMLRCHYEPFGSGDYFMALAAVCLAGCVSFAMVRPLVTGMIIVIERFGYRRLSCFALLGIVTLVAFSTGWMGVLVMVVAAGIGMVPILFGSRRMNCLGIILLPLACNLSGFGGAVADLLHLL